MRDSHGGGGGKGRNNVDTRHGNIDQVSAIAETSGNLVQQRCAMTKIVLMAVPLPVCIYCMHRNVK